MVAGGGIELFLEGSCGGGNPCRRGIGVTDGRFAIRSNLLGGGVELC